MRCSYNDGSLNRPLRNIRNEPSTSRAACIIDCHWPGILVLYLSWGTTYFAISLGVKDAGLPPGLFGGVRVLCAGLVLLLYLRLQVGNFALPHST